MPTTSTKIPGIGIKQVVQAPVEGPVRPVTTPTSTSGNIGSYQGVAITPGDNANVAAQVAAIDAKNKAPVITPTTESSSQNNNSSTPSTPKRTIKSTNSSANDPNSFDNVYQEQLQAAQGEINSLSDYYQTLTNEQNVINQKNDRNTSSISTLTGLAGSSEADVQQQATSSVGQKANNAIKAEQEMKVQEILGKVRSSAIEESRNRRLEASQTEASRIANRKAAQEESITNIQNLTSAGVTLDGLKSGDPTSYKHLVDTFGSEDALKGAFILNTPKEQILDKQVIGGRYIISKQNPVTGKITIENLDLGLPAQFTKSVDLGNKIMFYDENDPTQQMFVDKGAAPGVNNQTIDNERALFSQFKSEPIVKTYNDTLNKKLSVDAIVDKGVGGPADLAVVFEFMKGLDPSSVVRESEYESAAKSGNIFAGAFAKFNGYFKAKGGVLPDNVKQEFKSLIGYKLDVSKRQYDNIADEYRSIAERQQLNPDNVVAGYSKAQGPQTLQEYYNQSPENASAINQMITENPDLTDEEIFQIFSGGGETSFNSVGNTTASRIASAIKTVESKGNYSARGKSGESGAYQFMPDTWKQWAGEFLGNPNAPMTKQNQDYVALSKIQSLIDKGYNEQQIALIWNGGSPTVKKGVNKYGVKYDSGAYSREVLSKLNNA